jgi:hypothetical protein
MRMLGTPVLLLGATVFVAGATASAQNACVIDAHQTYQDCKQSCRDDFIAARLTCRNIDPVCGSACVDANRTCRQTVENYLDTGTLPDGTVMCSTTDANSTTLYGTNGCNTVLQEARQACWTQFCVANQTCTSCGDPNISDHNGCYECVDPAQLAAFTCRDTCRDSFRQNATVKAMKKQCKTTLHACITACPPLVTPTP